MPEKSEKPLGSHLSAGWGKVAKGATGGSTVAIPNQDVFGEDEILILLAKYQALSRASQSTLN